MFRNCSETRGSGGRSAGQGTGSAAEAVVLERTASDAEPAKLVQLLGDIERLKASLWQRLLVATTSQASPAALDPESELRHLTPQQVGEILSLKAAYVHELCRTGRIPAIKSGKYWMIPVEGLRQWLAYQKHDVDGRTHAPVQSVNPRGDVRPLSHTRPAGRPRRSLVP
jgi:excisionase family DNA binding protein